MIVSKFEVSLSGHADYRVNTTYPKDARLFDLVAQHMFLDMLTPHPGPQLPVLKCES